MYKYFKTINGDGNGSHIYYGKYKGLLDEGSKSITTSNYSVLPYLDDYVAK